ncbi:cytosolic sulfotransferase 5-like [Silene latifolia]|uniref:cytosolic sulfotransferase 5-like n=1 Tax=Silene latifolia TaxID=37657 RepID=UPI003D777862
MTPTKPHEEEEHKLTHTSTITLNKIQEKEKEEHKLTQTSTITLNKPQEEEEHKLTHTSTLTPNKAQEEEEKEQHKVALKDEVEKLRQCLPKATFMGTKFEALKYQGFWCALGSNRVLEQILTFQRHFQAKDTDLIIASLPKTGTTWLKSLLYSVVNRVDFKPTQSPLLTHNPHELVYHLEISVYGEHLAYPNHHQLDELPSPRLLHTHLPYDSLPESIRSSKSKILYIGRNPMDTFVSHWHFFPKMMKNMSINEDFKLPSIEEYFEEFCQGKILCGPFFEHVLGYWKQSLELPNKVLFLKYEDLKDDPIVHLKKLAEFVGVPFTPQEENDGVVKEIIELCSINNLKELEVNKSGIMNKVIDNKTFFRKGEVGDWTNYFNSTMEERMKNLMKNYLDDVGLSFKLGTNSCSHPLLNENNLQQECTI